MDMTLWALASFVRPSFFILPTIIFSEFCLGCRKRNYAPKVFFILLFWLFLFLVCVSSDLLLWAFCCWIKVCNCDSVLYWTILFIELLLFNSFLYLCNYCKVMLVPSRLGFKSVRIILSTSSQSIHKNINLLRTYLKHFHPVYRSIPYDHGDKFSARTLKNWEFL